MKKYQIIYADPPWKYNSRANHKTRFRGGACGHYDLMTMEAIKNIPIKEMADKNCALFLWVTFPMLDEQIKLFKEWGFDYKTLGFSWIKLNSKNLKPFFGVGFYTKSNCEVCLLGVKGKMKPISNKISSVIISPRREHSRKPDEVRSKIVELFGNLPRVELFAREKLEGWDAWGNEVESDINMEDYKKRRGLNVNWIVGNLQNALDTWNGKLSEIYSLVTQSPADFKGGAIWNIILNINGALQAIGLALLVLFFVVGVVRTCTNFSELKRPEQAVKLFLRFAIAKGIVTYGLDLMLSIFKIIQGIVTTIMAKSSFQASGMSLPQSIIDGIEKCGFFESIPLWAVTLLGGLFVTVLSFILILTVYGRFFKLYMYTAIAPIPLSSFAGEPTQNIGKSFLKSYIAVCLEGAIIVLACVIFSAFVTNSPSVDTGVATVTMVWKYVGELIFNMLVLVGTIRLSDRIIREMMGI